MLAWCAATLTFAQGEPAILARGPRPVAEVPILGPSELGAVWGEYRHAGELIQVYRIAFGGFVPPRWQPAPCAAGDVYTDPAESTRSFVLTDLDDGALLAFSFGADYEGWCGFMTTFRERLRFFMQFSRVGTDVPLPAVLDIGG